MNGGQLLKRITGFFIIILAIPILIIIHREIAAELNVASSFNLNISNTIDISKPIVKIPAAMRDHNGSIFSEEYSDWINPVDLSEIPLFVQQLFLDSEDAEFYTHRGYDVSAIARALVTNTATNALKQGGSTITQQLVRMRFLSTEKTYERKLTEIFYAAKLEKQSSKNEIFEMYLNEMYFGNRVYGIDAAATYYFNRPLVALNEAEIAFISAIPNNPSLYNPLVNFELTKSRQERLLDTLVKSNRITEKEADSYKKMPIDLVVKSKEKQFPAYSTYVLKELESLISVSEGFSTRLANSKDAISKITITEELKERTAEVLGSGIIIDTALNPIKQEQDEQALTSLLQQKQLQAGAVVIDNNNREIISLYGGREYAKADFNRAFQAVRQPGSAIKPLIVYAPFFESGTYSENTAVNSKPICIGSFCPKNVGGFVYGTTSIREAFRHSHNTAAVRLLQTVGVEEAFTYLEPFNFNYITQEDKNYSAALGGLTNGVTPLELSRAFTGFIDGSYSEPHAIRVVKDRDGNVLYEWENKRIDVWTSSTVTTMRNLLKDVVLHGTGRGVPYTTNYTGGKTGTTDNYNDLWTAGMNEHYTTAVWIGYDNPESLQQVSSKKLHLKAFSALLQK